MAIEEFGKEWLGKVKASIDKLSFDRIDEILKILLEAYENEKHVFIFGNGGSAATASHFASDLGKGTICDEKGKPLNIEKRFKVVCLSDNMPLITAWANDASYEHVFEEQLRNFVESGDVVIGISGSGNSQNILNAIELANQEGATTIGMTGFGGGKLKELAKVSIVVQNNNMRQVEDLHMVLVHLISAYLNKELKK